MSQTYDEEKLSKYILGELSLSEQAEMDEALNSNHELKAEIEELLSVACNIQESFASISPSEELCLNSDLASELSNATYDKPSRLGERYNQIYEGFRKYNPYLPEFLFILCSLVLCVIDIRDIVTSGKSVTEFASLSYISCALLFFYIFLLIKRARKEASLFDSLLESDVITASKSRVTPLTLLKITFFLVFAVLLLML